MDARQTLAAARRSRARLAAMLEKRRWYAQVGDCHSGGGSEALARLQRELDRHIDAAAAQELAALQWIDALEDSCQREVLGYRYLNGWAWKEIARRMDYSQDWVKHLHAKAMKQLEGEKF